MDVPHTGILRLRGRIVDPLIAGATSIFTNFGAGQTLYSTVASDGSFSIMGSPEMAVGRHQQRLIVTIGGVNRTIARVRNVRLFGGPRVPPPPVALTAQAAGPSVSIQWSPDTGWPPTSYFVDVGSSPGASNIGTFPTAAPSLSATGVPDGRYYLRVRAANEAGVSGPSAEAVLTVGCAPPLPPTLLAPVVNGTSVTLAWQPSPTAGVSYTIVAGSTSGASNLAQIPVGAATTLSAVAPAGRYFVRVRAVTPCGVADSNEIELLVGLPPLPGAPSTLTHQVAAGTVGLAWQSAAGAVDGYAIEAGSQPGLSNLAVIRIGNVLSFSAAGVPPGTYFVRVRAFNATGLGAASNEVTVLVP
jgi:predicted phage tail protein